jgi:hypothetical protein
MSKCMYSYCNVNPRVDLSSDRDLAKKTDSAVRVDSQVPPGVKALDMIRSMDYQPQCIALELFGWAVLHVDNSDHEKPKLRDGVEYSAQTVIDEMGNVRLQAHFSIFIPHSQVCINGEVRVTNAPRMLNVKGLVGDQPAIRHPSVWVKGIKVCFYCWGKANAGVAPGEEVCKPGSPCPVKTTNLCNLCMDFPKYTPTGHLHPELISGRHYSTVPAKDSVSPGCSSEHTCTCTLLSLSVGGASGSKPCARERIPRHADKSEPASASRLPTRFHV